MLHLKNYFHTFLLFYVDCENGCLYLFAGLLNNKMQMNLAFNGHSEQNSSENNFIFKSDMIYWNCAYFCPVVHGRNPGPNYYAYLLPSILNVKSHRTGKSKENLFVHECGCVCARLCARLERVNGEKGQGQATPFTWQMYKGSLFIW